MASKLFSAEDQYFIDHSQEGLNYSLLKKSIHAKEIARYENMHLMDELACAYDGLFPQLLPFTGNCNFELHRFDKRKKLQGKGQAIHMFMDDYKFRAIWTKPERTIASLMKFDVIFTPDFSLYVDVPEMLNIIATFKTRTIGALLQTYGKNVIPTFSWGNVNSFRYCLKGLPTGSVLATCGIGNMHTKSAFTLWCYGMRKVEEELSPKLIFVYGDPVEIPGFSTELRFIQSKFISHRKHETIYSNIIG